MAMAGYHDGDLAAVERSYREIIAIDAHQPDANHNLGVALLQMRRPDEAVAYLEAAFRENPERKLYWSSYMAGLLQGRRLRQAAEALRFAAQAGIPAEEVSSLAGRIEAIARKTLVDRVGWLPDMMGDPYGRVLERLHGALGPRAYLEIGVETGATLALAGCLSIGVDPRFQFRDFATMQRVLDKPALLLYQIASDDFFARFNPSALFGLPIDFAFLDGMHLCEFLLRDFANTERHCRRDSVIALHDCLPTEMPMAERLPGGAPVDPQRQGFWTGDVWRTALLLKRRRPDLRLVAIDAPPTGLVLVTNLDPDSAYLTANHDGLVAEMLGWSLEKITLSAYYREMEVEPEASYRNPGRMLAKLGLRSAAAGSCSPTEPENRIENTLSPAKPVTIQTTSRGKSSRKKRKAKEEDDVVRETGAIKRLVDQGRHAAAEARAHSLIAHRPANSIAWETLGAVLCRSGKIAEAIEAVGRAAGLEPAGLQIRFNLANLLRMDGQLAEAEIEYRRMLALEPVHADALLNLGVTLKSLDRAEEAMACYRGAIAARPDFAAAHGNLASLLWDLDRVKEAEANYRSAVKIDPANAELQSNFANVLVRLKQLAEAEACCRRAIALKPLFAEAWNNLGYTLQAAARNPEAVAAYRRALEIRPLYPEAYSNLLGCLGHEPELTPEALFETHLDFGRRFEQPWRSQWPCHRNVRDPERVLKIGFVSSDFRDHAMAYFTGPLLASLALDPQLSLYAYSNCPVEDETTFRLRRHFKQWSRVTGVGDAAMAAQIAADGVDILVDLSGHYNGRLPVFARKPAPLQCAWIGYLGTTGLEGMDYYLADRHFLPRDAFDRYFTEKLVHLPCVAAFQPLQTAPAINPLPALANGYITFGSFSRLAKLNAQVVALWSKLLRSLPGSKLMLGAIDSESPPEPLIECFSGHGIQRERLSFIRARNVDVRTYLELHNRVDINLDPFPATGATTTCHALWMGVPTLTLAGKTPHGRLGQALLLHVGLESFVAHTPSEFLEKGLDWASRLPKLAEMRQTMRKRFLASPVGQPGIVARGFSEAFRVMWRRWCAGLPPDALVNEELSC